jgi:hypothetical protein
MFVDNKNPFNYICHVYFFARAPEAKTKHSWRSFITRPLAQYFSRCVIDLRRRSCKNESEKCTRVKNGGECTHTHARSLAGLMYSLSREEILIEQISGGGSEFGRGLLSYCCHINRTQELCAADGWKEL